MWKRTLSYALTISAAAAGGCTLDTAEATTADAMLLSSSFERHAPCLSESDYVPRAGVSFGYSDPFYSPRCARLASGGTVVFGGSFATHPLVPRSSPSPIIATREGGSIEFEFPDPGFFPFGCANHPEETGVIWSSAGF